MAKERPRTTSAKSASMGSIRTEWKAWPTRSGAVDRPRSRKYATVFSTAASSPGDDRRGRAR
ncbi:hypothetical protein SGLAM104S_05347 [Streptomyces glaucescens]